VPRLTLAALVLAGCAAAPAGGPLFRDPAAPIWSAAAFDPARLPGTWRAVAAFGAGCGAGGVAIAADLSLRGRLCLGGRDTAVAGRLAPIGPGRLALPATGDWWVVWVDEGYRTLAVGTPSGRWGFVLDRADAAPDRLAAAAEILDFNGYDTARLVGLR
jgi:apolipoprotein D and lipocalin family protein